MMKMDTSSANVSMVTSSAASRWGRGRLCLKGAERYRED